MCLFYELRDGRPAVRAISLAVFTLSPYFLPHSLLFAPGLSPPFSPLPHRCVDEHDECSHCHTWHRRNDSREPTLHIHTRRRSITRTSQRLCLSYTRMTTHAQNHKHKHTRAHTHIQQTHCHKCVLLLFRSSHTVSFPQPPCSLTYSHCLAQATVSSPRTRAVTTPPTREQNNVRTRSPTVTITGKSHSHTCVCARIHTHAHAHTHIH